MNHWQKLVAFSSKVYEPKQHLLFASLWFLSIQGMFILHDKMDNHWTWSLSTFISAITFFGMLFVLRAIDEVKDLEYDQQFNPDRPLVSGVVTVRNIERYVVIGSTLLILINVAVSWKLAAFVMLNIGYGLCLVVIEKRVRLMNTSMFFNLLVTYPVSIALSFYALLQSFLVQNTNVSTSHFMIIGCYILAFLHFEIIRKSMLKSLSSHNEKLYSSEIGCTPALLLGSVCGVLAIAGIISINQPWRLNSIESITGWLPLLNLTFIIMSWRLFSNANRTGKQNRFNPRRFSVPFIVCFYLFNLIHSITMNQHQLSPLSALSL